MILHRLLAALLPILALAFTAKADGGHLALGVDAGTAIDMSGNDMSTLNIGITAGYKGGVIDMAGIGVAVNMMVNNNSRAFPLFGIVRTGFRSTPTLCFMELRGGVAFNNVSLGGTQTVPYINPAIGFNLARSASFTSYITVGYVYNGMKSFGPLDRHVTIEHGGLHMVRFALGISF